MSTSHARRCRATGWGTCSHSSCSGKDRVETGPAEIHHLSRVSCIRHVLLESSLSICEELSDFLLSLGLPSLELLGLESLFGAKMLLSIHLRRAHCVCFVGVRPVRTTGSRRVLLGGVRSVS